MELEWNVQVQEGGHHREHQPWVCQRTDEVCMEACDLASVVWLSLDCRYRCLHSPECHSFLGSNYIHKLYFFINLVYIFLQPSLKIFSLFSVSVTQCTGKINQPRCMC